jgi:hypothetical protein
MAGELVPGEQVLTKNGEAAVASKVKLDGVHTVYNLEVRELHNFLVGDVGVVVHNSCWKAYMDSFFPTWTKVADPNNNWVDYIVESKPGSLKERQQLSRLGEYNQERMTVLTKDKTNQDFPGIDGISENGRPISLKEVSSPSIGTLKDRIEEMGVKATNAKNGSLPQLVDIDGMITANNFTKSQIMNAIDEVRSTVSQMTIVKKIFIEGSDGSIWY